MRTPIRKLGFILKNIIESCPSVTEPLFQARCATALNLWFNLNVAKMMCCLCAIISLLIASAGLRTGVVCSLLAFLSTQPFFASLQVV